MRNLIVATAVATACLTSTAFAADESTKVTGTAFLDWTSINKTTTAKANGAETKDDGNGYGFDIKRFYVGIDHTFNDVWAANITTDVAYSSTVGNVEVFVKKAYLQATFDDAFVLRAGSSDTPWMGMIDGLYGYRYVEKSVNDLTGVVNTADWGLHASGKFADGKLNYAVSLVDGAGYKNPKRSKNMDLEGRLSYMPIDGLTFAIGAYTGKKGLAVESNPAENTFSRYNLAVAYVVKEFRVGVEYYTLKNLNSVQTTTGDTDKAKAYSIWAAYNFSDDFSVFVRHDDQKRNPSDTLASAKEDTFKYTQVGVAYKPHKKVDLALVYKNTKNDTNYGTTDNKTNEIGVFSQVKF